ncbi:hypothetical protein ACFQPF_11215 [Fictibacillus iocasae]|uniref:Uncharacterized protein n=1 Tax=Fictibacillus iocasae TaxID=2715437 RepID=A0ABW2NUD6_9BACL
MSGEAEFVEQAFALLDILTVLLVEDNPVLGVSFVVLVRMATDDRLQRLLFIMLVIVLSLAPHH